MSSPQWVKSTRDRAGQVVKLTGDLSGDLITDTDSEMRMAMARQ
jgi:hypothetical protein